MNILALSPHTDDVELGAGGSLSRWKAEGATILSVAFSTGDSKTGSSGAEFMAACDILGAEGMLLAHRSRYFHDTRQDILGELERIRDQFHPDLVLCHTTSDVHQDHQVVTREAIRAFKTCSLLGYGTMWSTRNAVLNYYVRLTQANIERKLRLLACYQSQQESRHYFRLSVVLGRLHVHGARIKTEYAEAFEVIRWVE